jgi:hypothetical protein
LRGRRGKVADTIDADMSSLVTSGFALPVAQR